jgi:hypothetical protein
MNKVLCVGVSMEIDEIIISVVFYVILAIPFWKMYDKTGINKGWLIVLFVPVIGYFVVWVVLAASKWPKMEQVS